MCSRALGRPLPSSLHSCTLSFCWCISPCFAPPAQVELQGVSLVVLSFFRDLDAATELANTVAAAGGIMGAAVCCAENGGDPKDDWTTCDRDRDMLLDRSPFDTIQMNIFPVTCPMQRKGIEQCVMSSPESKSSCHVGAAITSLWLYSCVSINSATCMLALRCALGDTGTGDQGSSIALFTAAQFKLWHIMQAATCICSHA